MLHGQREISYSEITVTIGKAIGQPSLKYVKLTREQFSAPSRKWECRELGKSIGGNGRVNRLWLHQATGATITTHDHSYIVRNFRS
jgi:hypothetical protein